MENYKENPDYIKLYELENRLSKDNLKYEELKLLNYEQFKILSKYYDKYCEVVKNTFKDIVKKYGNIVDEKEFLTKMQVVESYDKSENNTFQFFANEYEAYDGTIVAPYIEFSYINNSLVCYISLPLALMFDENLIKKKIYETISQIFYKYKDKLLVLENEIFKAKQKYNNVLHQQVKCISFIEEYKRIL